MALATPSGVENTIELALAASLTALRSTITAECLRAF
ncbi:hypothetical protein Psta_3908 [Pirellula staleyi DSM 6068]|uniref:Uncharacterized protein n=1 Tax=Pirellula staleyi (strain ATCC 27377 / DSM 6068 / ICPB 4128) TaxID=530564 RepID=D2R177_PIRSD|nr:hypothetical protein Psta_3908 [Pirellula staleyi DSM 6068]